MSKLRYSVSLDGDAAGPNQGPRHPLAEGGELLHRWMRETAIWRRAAGFRGGVRLFDDPALSRVRLELVDTIEAPGVPHLTYRVIRKDLPKGRE